VSPMKTAAVILAVSGGGVLGALLRLAVSECCRRLLAPSWVFLGTTVVNLAGCFAIGVLGMMALRGMGPSPLWSRFLITGFLGSLTTFSAFAFETTQLLEGQRFGPALLHVVVNVVAGLMLVKAGMMIVR
jgi:fluoride exporter